MQVESVTTRDVDGQRYINWEAIARGSPNTVDPTAATYRHSLGATAMRDGYFFTLTATGPDLVWDEARERADARERTESARIPGRASALAQRLVLQRPKAFMSE